MLGAHPECLCVPEMGFKFRLLSAWDTVQTGDERERTLDWLRRDWRFRNFELDTPPHSLLVPDQTYQEFLQAIVRRYGERHGKPEPRFWIDHTPRNTEYAWALLPLFPEAIVLHIVRDGRAVAASVMPLDWGPNQIHKAAEYWSKSVGAGLAAELWNPPQIVRVRYEDLIQQPASTLRHLCSRIGIDYQDGMSQGAGFTVPRYTSKQHNLVGQPPDPTRASSWERQLSQRQIEIFESIAGDLLQYLGYSTRYGMTARSMSPVEMMALHVREIYRREVVNKFRIRSRRALAGTSAGV
jgi:hypothetical protein